MEILAHIRERRTVRRFRPDPIPQHALDVMFEAAMWAPSHANLQPWDLVVVGPQARARLLEVFRVKTDELLADPSLPPAKRASITALRDDFGGAPFMVGVVSRAPADDLQRIENPLSTAAAVQNLVLAAWGAGVGAVWLSVGASPPARKILGINEGESVVALLAVGYPAEVPPAPAREPYTAHLREID